MTREECKEFIERFGDKPRYRDEQLAMLEQCSEKKDVLKWNEWQRENAPKEIWLEGVDLWQAHLKRALLWEAHLKGAVLRETHLEGAELDGAHLEGADLKGAHLEGANFTAAIVDGNTLFQDCTIDDETNFTMVGLDSARIDPSLLTALKTNIRRFEWEKHCKKLRTTWSGKIKARLIKFFWEISDYGSNTTEILWTFFKITLVFSALYGALDLLSPDLLTNNSSELIYHCETGWSTFPNVFLWFWQILCFTIATMVTLGFGGINIAISPSVPWLASFAGLTLVTLNLASGYFLLAVLVTRIGILFQSLGPEQAVEKFRKTREE